MLMHSNTTKKLMTWVIERKKKKKGKKIRGRNENKKRVRDHCAINPEADKTHCIIGIWVSSEVIIAVRSPVIWDPTIRPLRRAGIRGDFPALWKCRRVATRHVSLVEQGRCCCLCGRESDNILNLLILNHFDNLITK